MTAIGSETPGIIFDNSGEAWPAQSAQLVERLGHSANHIDVIANAVKNLGFVHVAPIRDVLLVTFEPTVVCPLAAVAAFYEISAHAAKRLILAYPGRASHPDRCEVFNSVIEGLRRLDEAANRTRNATRPLWLQGLADDRRLWQLGRGRFSTTRSSGAADPLASRLRKTTRGGDLSERLSRPLASISADDEWLGQLLRFWGSARRGRRLPSNESLERIGTVKHRERPGAYRQHRQFKSGRVSLSTLGGGQLLWRRIRQSRAW